MPINFLVVAIDDDPEPLSLYADYFLNPGLQRYGINPTYVPTHNIDELKVALKNPLRPGLLITDGHIGNWSSWRDSIEVNSAQENPLEMIVISRSGAVVNMAKQDGFHAGIKAEYVYALNKFLHHYLQNHAGMHKS